jgi:hypothetical protein
MVIRPVFASPLAAYPSLHDIGMAMTARIQTMATTTNNSIRVNARLKTIAIRQSRHLILKTHEADVKFPNRSI